MSFTENLGKAETLLARYDGAPILNHIGGEDRTAASGATFETISPIDLSVIGTAARGDATDIDAAAKAAHDAFPAWRDMDGAKRRAILHKIADGIVARAEEIALLECVDTGQALRFMSKAALRGAENFRFFADKAPYARDGQSLFANNQMNVTSRRPIGPVGVITPWNTPFMLSTWKIAPAMAAGCTVVHKPAELSPVTARILMEIAAEAGLPPGVWNLVNGLGEEAGLGRTEQEAQQVEGGLAVDEGHGGGRQSPGRHDAREPGLGPETLQQQVGRHFENGIADEEQSCTQSVGGGADAHIGGQMAAHEADVDAVDVVDDEHHHEQRQYPVLDLADRLLQDGGLDRSEGAGRWLDGFHACLLNGKGAAAWLLVAMPFKDATVIMGCAMWCIKTLIY